jgi:hypothetical protein
LVERENLLFVVFQSTKRETEVRLLLLLSFFSVIGAADSHTHKESNRESERETYCLRERGRVLFSLKTGASRELHKKFGLLFR